jgi:hypothetical protein
MLCLGVITSVPAGFTGFAIAAQMEEGSVTVRRGEGWG